MNKKKVQAIVLLSGGLDSAVALYWAKSKGFEPQSLAFNYFKRSQREIKAARTLARRNGSTYREVNLGFLKEIEDLRIQNPCLRGAESAYIPSRNVIFYGIASSYAEIIQAKYIVGGHNSDDVKLFPDSSLRFFEIFNETTKIGLFTGEKTGRVLLPFAGFSKAEVVRLGAKLRVPFEETWSCYSSATTPCNKCRSCRLRADAFKVAKLNDPLLQ